MTTDSGYQQMVGRGLSQAESETTRHEYVLSGYKVKWPDGSHEIGEICRNCGNTRIVVMAFVEDSLSTIDDKFLNTLDKMHGIFLPPSECPPSDEWQAATKACEKVLEWWERVKDSRRYADRQITAFEETVSEAEPLLKAAGGTLVDLDLNPEDDSGG